MLQDFLNRVASVTGKTYTPEEFGAMCAEAITAARKKAKAEKALEEEVSKPEKEKEEEK